MPKPPAPKITAWSWSRLYDWEQCPARCKYKHLLKMKEPESPVLLEGQAVHKQCEHFMTGAPGATFTPAMETFREEFEELKGRLKRSQIETELKVALDKDWTPVDWFSYNAWLRLVIDLTYLDGSRREIVDYKTGKKRESAFPQLRLYNLAAFFMGPAIKVAHSAFWYLDLGTWYDETLLANGVKNEVEYWMKRVAPMFADRAFLPAPGNHCRWCAFSKVNGGPCQY